ncbi:MAG: hypothetical protein WC412_04455 [Candidatus Omnitrophota bacterium]|jgi:T5SS/PEP-CTERM-associated repeat protein
MRTLVFAVCSFLTVSSLCIAEDYTWDNPSGGFFGEPNNWDPNGVPGDDGGDTVRFTLPTAYTVTLDNYYNNDTLYVDGGSAVTLDIAGYEYILDYSPESSQSVVIGEYGQGSLLINNGNVFSLDVSIGQFGGSVGSLTLSGSTTQWTTLYDEGWHGVSIGEDGDATLSVLDNAQFRHGHGGSAVGAESNATVDVNGIDSEWYVDGEFDMSVWGDTMVNIANGGKIDIGKLNMASEYGSSAQINITGEDQQSELQLHADVTNSLTIGKNGMAAVRVYGSKLLNTGTMTIGENPGSSGLLEVHEKSWVDTWNSIAIGGSLDNSGGRGQLSIIDDNPGDEYGVDFTPTEAAGQFIKVWPQGTIAMDGGAIEMEYDVNMANPIILQGGTLQGNGMIWAHVENHGGLVAPWDEEDNKVLEIGYNYTQDATGTLKIAIAGRDPVSQYAHLRAVQPNYGQVSLDGILDVDLIDGFVPSYGDEFIIIAAQNISGTFSNAVSQYVFQDGSFDVIYNTDSYDSVILTHYNPEPACLHYPVADMNRDCKVNLLDFAIFAGEWLDCNLVPESYCP